ncbi:MAG: tetratricopeptide repeat protein [Magnetococcales bacterium]|nr:tetratricopeptide repeat protein [Magnetococcales bacterium]MBF0149824.1 tetratricopeptide repeat protein [Magnetococcales bacterium]MBF0173320.1 tetratricopeptide repeat protein [Magnetococcales bacterium]MBF0346413.1 tetratricopeptide repeat protein [Magnetococcales bacterium]
MNEAIGHFMQALRSIPDRNPTTLIPPGSDQPQLTANLMGIACHQLGRLADALVCYQQALTLKPHYSSALSNRGLALMALGDPEAARAAFQHALQLQPDFPEAHANLGTTFQEQDRYAEAEGCFRTAIKLDPHFARAWYNLGLALQAQGHYTEALQSLRQARGLDPTDPDAPLAESLILLLLGEDAAGWPLHEWRWQVEGVHPHGHPQPLWDGGDFSGKTLLLHCEQGFGDSIQFIRFVPWVKRKGGTVVVQCPPALYTLFLTMPGIDHLVTTAGTLPSCDLQVPLMSLPHLLRMTRATLPRSTPYLKMDARCPSFFQQQSIPPFHLKVGLSWRGNPKHKNDRNRSIDPHRFSRLWTLEGCTFIGLQKHPSASDLAAFAGCHRWIDPGSRLDDFAVTAAIIAQLDLVIAVDSAVIHLAGAMNHPAWVLLPKVPDWRWGAEGDDCPWYPSVRPFRQPRIGDWDAVIDQVFLQLIKKKKGA